jgi:hypothetical protein
MERVDITRSRLAAKPEAAACARPRGAVRPGSYHRRQPVAEKNRDPDALLVIEEADAWFEYLEATRGLTALRYLELEPWAWARLRQRRRAIRARRAKLRPAKVA